MNNKMKYGILTASVISGGVYLLLKQDKKSNKESLKAGLITGLIFGAMVAFLPIKNKGITW